MLTVKLYEAVLLSRREFMLDARKVLLVPPDATRPRYLGELTALYYDLLRTKGVQVDILPALGTHAPMPPDALAAYFGTNIPAERFLVHRWRDGITKIGEIPAALMRELSGGFYNEPIAVEVADALLDASYDYIISIGQVVPHEVAGMANYTKNIVVGCGGAAFINASHMVGAIHGIERTLGQTDTPVRRLFDHAQAHFLAKLPIIYVLTAADATEQEIFIGRERRVFEEAAAWSGLRNITHLPAPVQHCVVELGEGVHSTWLGNKAIYRTRMAIADGGQLIILAPNVQCFGEDAENDRLIRRYGYCGREKVLDLCRREAALQANLSVAAHLIHGSSDGRFTITYAAPKPGRQAVETAGFHYMEWEEALRHRDFVKQQHPNTLYVENPALGLWAI